MSATGTAPSLPRGLSTKAGAQEAPQPPSLSWGPQPARQQSQLCRVGSSGGDAPGRLHHSFVHALMFTHSHVHTCTQSRAEMAAVGRLSGCCRVATWRFQSERLGHPAEAFPETGHAGPGISRPLSVCDRADWSLTAGPSRGAPEDRPAL